MAEKDEFILFREYVAILRRGWPIIVLLSLAGLGAAYLVLGEGPLAREHLAKAVALDPDGDFGRSASRALHEMGQLGGALSRLLLRVGKALRRARATLRTKKDS